jgi:hypothetical protein
MHACDDAMLQRITTLSFDEHHNRERGASAGNRGAHAMELACHQLLSVSGRTDAMCITTLLQKTTRNPCLRAMQNPVDQPHVQK